MPSPPKPWEVNSTANAGSAVAAVTNSLETAPTVPNRPSTMSSNYNAGYGTSNLNSSSYGSGRMGSYSSPYNRMGYGGYGSGYGSGYGGGYGGYSSGYGSGYGGGYSGYNSLSPYNRMGYNNGMGMMGETPLQQMESSTRATFDVIGSIVQAFGGFAQMLDSTYMATHSSFMAMVGVAEQFGNLRHYLGNIFNLFGLLRWLKRQYYKLTGKTMPTELLPKNETIKDETLQASDESDDIDQGTETKTEPIQQRRGPIIAFLAIVTSLPYLIYKLLERSHRLKQERMMIPQYGGPVELAKVVHTFHGENPMELTIRQGDDIQILSKIDPVSGLPCDWWQGRLPNGMIGIFPANHVQIY